VSFAVLAAPAVAAQPFEQTELDRVQPDVSIKERPARVTTRAFVDHNFVAPAL
jgi:hypothetical protein